MKKSISELIRKSIETKEKLADSCLEQIEAIATLCITTLRNGGKLIFCGNGGSAADSQHLAAELVVRFKKDRRSLPALSLNTNTSILTAAGNDYGFSTIFSRQLESLAEKKDVLIAITTSGKSQNIIEAVKKARKLGVKTIAFTGKKGKAFAKQCTLSLVVPETDTARIQEAHACVGHIVCELIEQHLF